MGGKRWNFNLVFPCNFQESNTTDIEYMGVATNMLQYVDRYVSATVNVTNARNLTSSVEIRGLGGHYFDMDGNSYDEMPSRSYAFICTEQTSKTKSHHKRIIEFGQRIPGDFVVRFQHEHSNEGKFNLDFHDPDIKINYILVAVDVRTTHMSEHFLKDFRW